MYNIVFFFSSLFNTQSFRDSYLRICVDDVDSANIDVVGTSRVVRRNTDRSVMQSEMHNAYE